MDVVPPKHHDPAAGDDELAKVLAGVSDDPNEQPRPAAGVPGLQFEATPAPGSMNVNMAMPAPVPQPAMPSMPTPAMAAPQTSQMQMPAMPAAPSTPAGNPSGLDELKREALGELRPLVDKLELPPEEKFDTLLLIIRSTDDQSLLTPAHEAAKAIADETKRAQALLDVIKEIDYFGGNQQNPLQ
jgi:hypothetical protein